MEDASSTKFIEKMKKLQYNDRKVNGNYNGHEWNLKPNIDRRGLGFSSDDSETFSVEEDTIRMPDESICWCPAPLQNLPSIKEIKKWPIIDQKKLTFEDEVLFIEWNTLQKLLDSKKVFEEFELRDMHDARFRSNPYELIGSGIFMNRAALKLAEIDAKFAWMFSHPFHSENGGVSLRSQGEPLYFADICSGPGGFSEYMFWRLGWQAKGFGFTLKGPDDFRLDSFIAGGAETFEPFYGSHADGNIADLENINSLKSLIMESTNNRGVHCVMGDGGFDVEGQENIQEILSKKLYLYQCICALEILREGGNFVCKTFDIFTPFSVGLIYLMRHAFTDLCIYKPLCSRPANAERYLVCRSLRCKEIVDSILLYLTFVAVLISCVEPDDDILWPVPLHVIDKEVPFANYIRETNQRLAVSQIRGLKKMRTFAIYKSYVDPRQSQIRDICFKAWQIPNEPRQRISHVMDPQVVFEQLMERFKFDCMPFIDKSALELLKKCHLTPAAIVSSQDFNYVFSFGKLDLLVSCGGRNVYKRVFSKNGGTLWHKFAGSHILELPAFTLLLIEKVREMETSFGMVSNKRHVLYILDGLFLGNENVMYDKNRIIPFHERRLRLEIFVKAMNKLSKRNFYQFKLHPSYDHFNIAREFNKLNITKLSENSVSTHITMFIADNVQVEVRGMYLLRKLKEQWSVAFLHNGTKILCNRHYKGVFKPIESVDTCYADLRSTLINSYFWKFDPRKPWLYNTENNCGDEADISLCQFLKFLEDDLILSF